MLTNKHTILVADDDPDILEAIRLILEIAHYHVVTVQEGKKIVKEIQKTHPDLVLLDIWMSGISGIDISRVLRKEKAFKSLPILLISAGIRSQSSLRQSGANDFVAKPFDMHDLIAKVQKYVDQPEER